MGSHCAHVCAELNVRAADTKLRVYEEIRMKSKNGLVLYRLVELGDDVLVACDID